jgi:hypothetical protein
MDQNALDLCGIAVIGKIFSWGSGFSLMSSQNTSLAWPALTFSMLTLVKWASASGDRDDWWGPQATASQMSAFDHGRPIFVGPPSWDHFARSSPAKVAIPKGHISLW